MKNCYVKSVPFVNREWLEQMLMLNKMFRAGACGDDHTDDQGEGRGTETPTGEQSVVLLQLMLPICKAVMEGVFFRRLLAVMEIE